VTCVHYSKDLQPLIMSRPHVRYRSKAGITKVLADVRFTPES
jgi:hypothetical protein